MLKQLVVFVLILAPALVAQGQTINRNTEITVENLNTVGGDRYSAVEPLDVQTWAIFGSQAQYKDEEQFNGFGRSTAGQLGLSMGYNEMPGNKAPAVLLNPNEPVTYNGSEYWLDNCKVNGKAYKNRFKPIAQPAPPATAVPQPAPAPPAPCRLCEPSPLPVCQITGDPEEGFIGHATNGTGVFSYDGQPSDGDSSVVEDGKFFINKASVGTHAVRYVVTGDLGVVACEAKFDVFAELTTRRPQITIPKIGFCDTDHDGWRPDRMLAGMVEQVRCRPGATLLNGMIGSAGGFGLSRISHGGSTPPVHLPPKSSVDMIVP